jgi:uncharacterized protein
MIAGIEYGWHTPLHVRHERIEVRAETSATWRLVYASDLHLTARRASIASALVDVVARQRVDAVLLGGDLLDRRSGAKLLAATVEKLTALAPVFGVAGNHDEWLGQDVAGKAVRTAGGHWLHDDEAELVRDGARLQLHAGVRARGSRDAPGVRLLVGHHPSIIEAAAAHYDVVLAGHLHGGQCVWWQRGGRLYPGAWFSRWNGLRFRVGNAVLLVSRGAADTLPVRFRCPREVLSCEIQEVGRSSESIGLAR